MPSSPSVGRSTQVGSGRDLVREVPGSTEKTILALADGKGDLPFSRAEVDDLAVNAAGSGWSTTVLVGDEASESALFARRRPRILHLATHSVQLDEELAKAWTVVGGLRSGRPRSHSLIRAALHSDPAGGDLDEQR